MNLLIIGKRSVLCNLFLENTRIKKYKVYSRRDINKINFNKYTHILNFSFNSKLQTLKYKEEIDFDLKLAKIARDYKIIFIMFSSRLVYSGIKCHYKEKLKLNPESVYGQNKVITEDKIRKIFPKKHLIIRLTTMIYFSLSYNKKRKEKNKRELFMIQMLNSLKNNNKITFDFSKNTYKDFIIPSYYAKSMDVLISKNATGTYNLCSGIKIKVKNIAEKIIYGFKKGKVFFNGQNNKDQSFSMSNKLLLKKTGISLSLIDIYDYCIKIGLKTRNE
jgi:hypothetical protein